LSSNSGQPGSTFTIYGVGFCSNPSVTINSVTAPVVSSTATQIVVTVPNGATTGEILITCGSNTIDAGMFNAASGLVPTITGFSPPTGGPGSSVTIAGTNIQANGANVLFNTLPALVTSASSTSLTAIVPSNATSGPIAVLDQYGEATSSNNFIVLPPGVIYEGQAVVNGSPTPISLEASGQQGLLTFQGVAGERVLISFDDTQLDCMSSVTVNNPDGSSLGSLNDLCYVPPEFLEEVLPTTGVYSILVNDGYDPGSLSVSVANVAQMPTISIGGAAENVNVPVAQTSGLVFQANAGDQISLEATFPGNSLESPVILVVAPDGSIRGTAISLWNPACCYNIGQYLDSITLIETGTYVILNASSESDIEQNIGDQITVQLYSAPIIEENIAIGGPSVTLNPSAPGQTAQLTFSGSAGETVSFGYVTPDFPAPTVSGTNPDGSTFSFANSSWYGSGGNTFYYSGPYVLPQDGTYQINLDFLGHTQPVVTHLYDATPESGTISIGGPAVAVSTGPGQHDNLSFAGTAGQQISVGVSSLTYPQYARVLILNPDGSNLNSFEPNSAYASGAFTLPQTGTYVAQVGGSQPGTLNLQLYDATPVNGSISIDGPAVSMNTNPGQPLELSLSATAGQYSGLDISGSSYAGVTVYAFNPDGSSLGSGSSITGSEGVASIPIFPVTGTYTIEVVGDGGPGSATLQLYSSAQENFTTSIGGPPVDVTLHVSGQVANITFSASAGQWVSLATSNSTLNGCAEIELLNPDGSWVNSVYACNPSDVMYASQLTQSGTYSIFVDGQGATGSIDIKLNDATPVVGTISIDGAPVDPSMSSPSQNFEYTFSGTTGQAIGLSVTNFTSYADCSPAISIFDPNGNYVDQQNLNPSFWPDGTASLGNGNDVLASDGTYSIFLDNTGCSSGSAEITLFTSTTLTGTITFNGPTVTVASTLPGQPTELTIGGGAGQTVYLNTSNSTYQDCVNIVLDDATSSVVDDLWQCGATGTKGPDALSGDGYTIWVYPLGAPGSIDLSLSSQSSGGGGGGPD
jgi:hypothetical protein